MGGPALAPAPALAPPLQPFTPEMAHRVWAWVMEHAASLETLVVHCEMGVSRSRGLALGLADVLLSDEAVAALEAESPRHNRWVRALMRETAPRALERAREQRETRTAPEDQ